jgi:hypothetical protein
MTRALLAFILLLSGCALNSIEGKKYQDIPPAFSIESFFDGDVKAWGIVQDRSGNVVQRFTVDIKGTVADAVLTLDESFTYGIGEGVTQRTWTIERNADGNYVGSASDILGIASGKVFGNAFNWNYQMDLPVGDSKYKVTFDDWIWSFDKVTLMNRSYIRKFGFTFAEVTIFMQKQN